MTIHIRAKAIVLLAQRVHPVPPSEDGVILACSVVIGVQSVHAVQFLAVVLVRLKILATADISNNGTEGVVVRLLLESTTCTYHLAVVAQVVLGVVEQRISIGCGGRAGSLRLGIAAVKEQHPCRALLYDKASAQQIVRMACEYGRVMGRVRLYAKLPRDVRQCHGVLHGKLLARGTVRVLRHIAVGEVYAFRVAVAVVGDVRNTPAPVGNQRSVAVVQILRTVGPLVLERARGIIVRCRLRYCRQPVAVVRHLLVICYSFLSHLVYLDKCSLDPRELIPFLMHHPCKLKRRNNNI